MSSLRAEEGRLPVCPGALGGGRGEGWGEQLAPQGTVSVSQALVPAPHLSSSFPPCKICHLLLSVDYGAFAGRDGELCLLW